MHIPDGLLSTKVWVSLDALAVPAVGYLARRANGSISAGAGGGKLPLLGVMGAFVFAAQMINFPVGPGTSGHLVGGALLGVTLGPWPAALVMTGILIVQALIFQDGGILALGPNILNMAVCGVLAGILPYRYLGSGSLRKASIFLGGALSVACGAALAVLELHLSGIQMPGAFLGLQGGFFAVNAILEGAITLAVVQGIESINASWVQRPEDVGSRAKGLVFVSAILLAVTGILFTSGAPDGLQSLLARVGFAGGQTNLVISPLADYEWRGLGSAWVQKAAAGLAGIGVIYALSIAIGQMIQRKRSR